MRETPDDFYADDDEDDMVFEPERRTPVVENCDVCVVGGSCTGVFAAIRAARLGARVVLIENNGFFGGVATAGLVNVWHSFHDTLGEKQIIAGLSAEIADTLVARGAAVRHDPRNESVGIRFNSAELILALDEAVDAHDGIVPMLHSRAVGVTRESSRDTITTVIVENPAGRRAVRAKMFIDATGNGDLARLAGLGLLVYHKRLPPTTCAIYSGLRSAMARDPAFTPERVIMDPQNPQALKGFLWYSAIPGVPDLDMVAGTRVNDVNACEDGQLTYAEMEGRRQVRRSLELLNAHPAGKDVRLVALPAHIGVRETRHATCLHQVTEKELLEGAAFRDTIGHGSYRVDIHFDDRPGLVFRYLDGRETISNPPLPDICGRWREERAVNPTFYNIPFRSLLPRGLDNLIVAGRAIDADPGAFGALRVMVNLNQTGEAAGVAAALAIETRTAPAALDTRLLRETLRKGGSAIM